jgi:hypothetical protein
MKEKIIKISILFLLFILSIFSICQCKKPIECKITKIIEADEFIIETKTNNKTRPQKTITLKDVSSFKPIKNYNQTQLAQKLNIKEEDFLKIGYLARAWSKETLLNKDVLVFGLKDCTNEQICKVDILANGRTYSNFLLKNGLGYIDNPNKNKKDFTNRKQLIRNISEISNLASSSGLSLILSNIAIPVLSS